MIALADCNIFFASVERALHPGLKGKPVCVLSSNDGNIVALTAEAKALGLKRGDPFFKVRDIIERNGVAVFSCNLMLYAAMSKRVQSIMRRTVEHTESYSIDEQFLYPDGYEKHYDLVELMRGMGAEALLKPGYQTWLELNGHPCIDTTEIIQRQTITTSRNFGNMISSKEDIKASVASFAASCCSTLRGQDSAAGCVSVFACSNRFREDLPQYGNIATKKLSVPSADTLEITAAAMELVERIYRPGILFKKSGVILSDIVPGCCHQILFDPIVRREERVELSETLDRMNHKYGIRTVGLAVAGSDNEAWKNKKEHLTPNYLTDIDQIMTVQI